MLAYAGAADVVLVCAGSATARAGRASKREAFMVMIED
jgi:hypothetical protein